MVEIKRRFWHIRDSLKRGRAHLYGQTYKKMWKMLKRIRKRP